MTEKACEERDCRKLREIGPRFRLQGAHLATKKKKKMLKERAGVPGEFARIRVLSFYIQSW